MKNFCQSRWTEFCASTHGAFASVLGLALPVLLSGAALTSDYVNWQGQRARLQAAADSGALAAARELNVSGRTPEQIKSIGEIVARSQGLDRTVSVSVTLPTTERVKVDISERAESLLAGLIGMQPGENMVSATGIVSTGQRKLCVLALDTKSSQSIYMKSNAQLLGRECLFQTNSLNSQAFYTDSGITVDGQIVCSSGGFSGQGRILGQRLTDCPSFRDPLGARPAPPVSASCDKNNHRVELNNSASSRHVLNPGVYCGGLFIGANSFVTLNPGIYVIKDGPLMLDSNADIVGKYVGFYLLGATAVMDFTSNAKVNLDGPRDGPMAGLLFFEDRAAPLLREHRITSNFATNLTGTIYMSRGRFVVDANNVVAEGSAYTVIIANQLLLTASPKLVLNANYQKTDVPVPPGISTVGAVRLEY